MDPVKTIENQLKRIEKSTEPHFVDTLSGKKRADLDKDRLLLSGILREFEILGEAANRVSDKTKHRFPELPWKELIGMRNRLIHVYFDVDHDIIWKTIRNYLPSLVDQLEQIVNFLH